MKLTTKGRYAVTAMLDLAINAESKPVTLSDIAERRGISLSYLEQLFANLRRHQLVKSIRGPGGGYQLNHPASAIVISSIIDAVNESTDVTACNSKANCHNGNQCLTHDLWCELSEKINQFLSSVTLKNVIEKQRIKQENSQPNVETPKAETDIDASQSLIFSQTSN